MIAGEAMLFLLSCLIGVGFGAVYDLFRAFRLIFPAGKKAAFIEDGLFFLLFAAVNFLFFLDHSFGRRRAGVYRLLLYRRESGLFHPRRRHRRGTGAGPAHFSPFLPEEGW